MRQHSAAQSLLKQSEFGWVNGSEKFVWLVFFFDPAAENSDDVLKDHVLKGQYVLAIANALSAQMAGSRD